MALILKSKNQILADMISKILADTSINDINPGSVLITLLEAVAREDFQQYVQMLNIIRTYNLDTTTGQDLVNRAFEYGLEKNLSEKATGLINILRPVGFVKVSTSLYSGLPNPIAGNTVIFVNDASNALFGSAGTLILGRGTSNEEEVTYSSAPTNFTNYWQFTVSPLTNSHSLNESVILKQGTDQLIRAGTSVIVLATSNTPQITFVTSVDSTLFSGEAEVDNVAVICQTSGTIGNIGIKAIEGTSAFPNPPFPGAIAQNLSRFTTGQDLETDDELRDRIKNAIQSLSRGTKTAISNAIVGLVDPDTAKRVVSTSIILPTNDTDPVQVYIDDGTGFEPSFSEVGNEVVLLLSAGLEQRLQLENFPLVKAQLESNASEPYNMSSGALTLSYSIGISSETITFNPSDFPFPNVATAGEIVTLINARSSLIEARTANSGTSIVIQAKSDTNEDIQVTGGSANAILLFPTDERSTLYLYKNNQLLSKDGSTATLVSGNAPFNFAADLSGPAWNLFVAVDGKTFNTQQIIFNNGSFSTPSAATAQEVVNVINSYLGGATAAVINGGQNVQISSNLQLSSSSMLHVTGGNANTTLGFSTVQSVGSNSDYVLNRETGQISLTSPLSANQNITAGSSNTRASLTCVSPEFYTIPSTQTLVISVDGGSNQTISIPPATYSAAQLVSIINGSLIGGTAQVYSPGVLNYLQIRTDTWAQSVGTIQIFSSSTAAAVLNFPLNTVVTNERPHQAFVNNTIAGPYNFVQNDVLIAILDNSPDTKTYTIFMNFAGVVTSVSGGAQFADINFNSVFTQDTILNNFILVFTSGINTQTGTIANVTNTSGNTWRYSFGALPTNLSHFQVGDQANITGLTNLTNNGVFLITAISTSGNGYIEVTNTSGISELLTNGNALLGQRRQINNYTASTGAMTIFSGFVNVPGIGDNFVILPYTASNVVSYLNNTKVTTLSTQADIELSNASARVQISSLALGSDGYIQVVGGSANDKLGFSSTLVQGLEAYSYYTGLTKLVNETIYGDDTNLVSFPGVGAAGITFQVKAPTVNEVSVSVVLTLSNGVTLSTVEDNVINAITGYINNLGLGQNVIVSEIIDQIMNLTNISDVEVVTPSANVIIGDNQVARTNTTLIVVSEI